MKNARILRQPPFWWPLIANTTYFQKRNETKQWTATGHKQELQLELKAAQDSLAKAKDELLISKSKVSFNKSGSLKIILILTYQQLQELDGTKAALAQVQDDLVQAYREVCLFV